MYQQDEKGDWAMEQNIVKTLNLELEVADTPAKQQLGLSHRESLADGRGMIFVFSTSSKPYFWMKDMRFPIDFIWLDTQLRIVDIDQNITPETYPRTFSPNIPAKYVIEVNAGYIQKNNLHIGDVLELPYLRWD